MAYRSPNTQKTLSFARRTLALATWAVPLVALTLLILHVTGVAVPASFAWKLLPLAFALATALELCQKASDHPLGPLLYQASKLQTLLVLGGDMAGAGLSMLHMTWTVQFVATAALLGHMTLAARFAPRLAAAARAP